MMDDILLSLLSCPKTKKNLVLADDRLIAKVNTAISEGKILNAQKEKVTEAIDGGLFREGDHSAIYPIRQGIPVLLVEELINISSCSDK